MTVDSAPTIRPHGSESVIYSPDLLEELAVDPTAVWSNRHPSCLLGSLPPRTVALLLAIGALALSPDAGRTGFCGENPRTPNIVFILADDLGYGELGCLGPWKGVRQNMLRPNNSDPLKIELYNLESDLGESRDVAAEHPEVVARIRELMHAQHVRLKRRRGVTAKVSILSVTATSGLRGREVPQWPSENCIDRAGVDAGLPDGGE